VIIILKIKHITSNNHKHHNKDNKDNHSKDIKTQSLDKIIIQIRDIISRIKIGIMLVITRRKFKTLMQKMKVASQIKIDIHKEQIKKIRNFKEMTIKTLIKKSKNQFNIKVLTGKS
jgi:hypothetical protein